MKKPDNMTDQEFIDLGLGNELKEAKVVVDTAIEHNDRKTLYKLYTVAKVLHEYLLYHTDENEEMGLQVENTLKTYTEYVNKHA